jgi:DNA-binding ferritin-like protein
MFSESSCTALSRMIALLRAVQIIHHTAHWQTAGVTFYGDHLLFERLYSGITEEFDGLAEKAVAYCGVGAVDAAAQVGMIAEVIATVTGTDIVRKSLAAEQAVQDEIEECRAALEAAGELPLGLDNFLQGLADSHETAIYLLQQRLA